MLLNEDQIALRDVAQPLLARKAANPITRRVRHENRVSTAR
jgi:hypothetical protein